MTTKKESLIIQPNRLTNAYYNFTPTQRDIITLIQKEAGHSQEIKRVFDIDLKDYFKIKNTDANDLRVAKYKAMVDEMLTLTVTFSPISGQYRYIKINLIEKVSINKDFLLSVMITESSLPLFYLNRITLKTIVEHEKETPFLLENEKDLKYIGFLPSVLISFKSFPVKRLYEKLLQYKALRKYSFKLSKTELYCLLGFATIEEKEKDQLFLIETYDVIENKYIGSQGWKTLSKQLTLWFEEINNNKNSGITILKQGTKLYQTFGRPIQTIQIDVAYNQELVNLSDDKLNSIKFLQRFKLSEKQLFNIISNFNFEEVKRKVNYFVVVKTNGKTQYYAQLQKPNHDKIDNIAGFIYAVVFQLGNSD